MESSRFYRKHPQILLNYKQRCPFCWLFAHATDRKSKLTLVTPVAVLLSSSFQHFYPPKAQTASSLSFYPSRPFSFNGGLRALKQGEERVTDSAKISCFALRPLLSSFSSFSNRGFCNLGAKSEVQSFRRKLTSELCDAVLPNLLGRFFMNCDRCQKVLTQMADLGCGVFDFGSLLLLFFVAFGVVIRVLQCGGLNRFCKFVGRSRVLRDGFCLKRVHNDASLIMEGTLPSKANGDHCVMDSDDDEELGLDEFHMANEHFEEEEVTSEDDDLSVTDLRELVNAEKRKADAALKDLEKERMAAASAVEEAMAMIFRLQNEKSALQIELNQLQRWAEEKQNYDEEVIQSLQWNLMQYEEERSLLEEELNFCKKRLKVYEKDDESDKSDCNGSVCSPCTPCLSETHLTGCKIDDLRIGSLDLCFASAERDPN